MSKYTLAADTIQHLAKRASPLAIDSVDAQEALLFSLIQTLREENGSKYVKDILQYEIDSLGSSDLYEIQRGLGHS